MNQKCFVRLRTIIVCVIACVLYLSVAQSADAKTVKQLGHHVGTNKTADADAEFNKAGKILREGMKDCKKSIQVTIPFSSYDENTYSKIYASAVRHTGKGNEGDYLKWQNTGWECDGMRVGDDAIITYTVHYISDKDKEDRTTKQIKSIEDSLIIDKKDEAYTKFIQIYDYICQNISYATDKDNLLTHTAYYAVTKKTAVCQGYSTLLYRLLLDYGIDNRIVVSSGHMWNLVQIGDVYYEADSTWDAVKKQENKPYQYMLRANISADAKDTDHTWHMSDLDEDILACKRAEKDFVVPTFPEKSTSNIAKDTTLVLFTSTLYAESVNGKQEVDGTYYIGSKPVVAALNFGKREALRKDKDYTMETIEKKDSVDFKIQGTGNYSGTIIITCNAKLKASELSAKKQKNACLLQWNKAEGATKYTIYRQVDNKAWVKVGTTNKTKYKSKSKKGVCRYYIVASSKNYKSPKSQVVTVHFKK
jgi:hypothetical protein